MSRGRRLAAATAQVVIGALLTALTLGSIVLISFWAGLTGCDGEEDVGACEWRVEAARNANITMQLLLLVSAVTVAAWVKDRRGLGVLGVALLLSVATTMVADRVIS